MLSAAPVNARSQMRRDSRPLGRRRVCGLGGGGYSTGAIGSVALDGAVEPGTAHGTAGEEGQMCGVNQVEHLASGGCQLGYGALQVAVSDPCLQRGAAAGNGFSGLVCARQRSWLLETGGDNCSRGSSYST